MSKADISTGSDCRHQSVPAMCPLFAAKEPPHVLSIPRLLGGKTWHLLNSDVRMASSEPMMSCQCQPQALISNVQQYFGWKSRASMLNRDKLGWPLPVQVLIQHLPFSDAGNASILVRLLSAFILQRQPDKCSLDRVHGVVRRHAIHSLAATRPVRQRLCLITSSNISRGKSLLGNPPCPTQRLGNSPRSSHTWNLNRLAKPVAGPRCF